MDLELFPGVLRNQNDGIMESWKLPCASMSAKYEPMNKAMNMNHMNIES
jgi:hypothetical protein